ncbi:MAG: hypothetical protein SynsKO_21670 [Synoicihabitans sp.]
MSQTLAYLVVRILWVSVPIDQRQDLELASLHRSWMIRMGVIKLPSLIREIDRCLLSALTLFLIISAIPHIWSWLVYSFVALASTCESCLLTFFGLSAISKLTLETVP